MTLAAARLFNDDWCREIKRVKNIRNQVYFKLASKKVISGSYQNKSIVH